MRDGLFIIIIIIIIIANVTASANYYSMLPQRQPLRVHGRLLGEQYHHIALAATGASFCYLPPPFPYG
jgi:uncharacterized membrane protein